MFIVFKDQPSSKFKDYNNTCSTQNNEYILGQWPSATICKHVLDGQN